MYSSIFASTKRSEISVRLCRDSVTARRVLFQTNCFFECLGNDASSSHIYVVYRHKHIKPRKTNHTLIFIAMPL